MNRRTLLMLLGALGLGYLAPSGTRAQTRVATGLFVLIDDLGPELSAEQVRALCEPLAQEVIPMGLGLRTGIGQPDKELTAYLASQVLERPELFEPVLRADGLLNNRAYFQMRSASLALQQMEQRFFNDAGQPPRISTVADVAPQANKNMDALRAIGIRNVLQITAHASFAVSGPCDGGSVCLRGTVPVALDGGAETLGTWLAGTNVGGTNILAVLSGADLKGRSPHEIRLRSEEIAAEIVSAVQGERAFVVPPREHLSWYQGTNAPEVVLLLELPKLGDVLSEASFSRLRTAFDTAGIPYSLTGAAPRLRFMEPDACPTPEAGSTTTDWIARRSALSLPTCLAGEIPPGLAADLAAAGLQVVFGPKRPGNPKLDEQGVLHWPISGLREMSGPTGTEDLVLGVTAEDYADPIRQDAVLAALVQASVETPGNLKTLSGFASDILPRDPVFNILRETRRDIRPAASAAPESKGERDAFLGDARAAWQSIAKNTEERTLLCPGTVHRNPDGVYAYPALTMWDLGSLIRATMAAHELGFITDVEFAVRAAALIDALPASRIGGGILPNELISTERTETLSNDFNVCDSGRLLSALAELNRYPQSKGLAAPAVARWDLASVIVNGHPHSVVGGRRVDHYLSHCAHYLARAYGLWGIDVASPYEVDRSGSTTDWQMRVLYSAADIGAYGAEPLLLEATEMGLSEPSRLLADVLWATQRRTWTETGQLVCVSEAPLDRVPWFVYSGLVLDTSTNRWVTRSRSSDPAFATEKFQKEALLVNTKGAFLWSAHRPGAFASMLLGHIRERARNDDGSLSPGVYSATGEGLPGYTDLNTHGVILDTVAYILRQRQPRHEIPE